MNRHELEVLYTLNNPATSQAIKMLPPEWHILYPSYLQFLELSNGLFGDEITLWKPRISNKGILTMK